MDKSYKDHLAAAERSKTDKTRRAHQRNAADAFNLCHRPYDTNEVRQLEAQIGADWRLLLAGAEVRDDVARVPLLGPGFMFWRPLADIIDVREVTTGASAPATDPDARPSAAQVVAESAAGDLARITLSAVYHEDVAREIAERITESGKLEVDPAELAEAFWLDLFGPGSWLDLPASSSDPKAPGRHEIEVAMGYALRSYNAPDIAEQIEQELGPYLVYREIDVEKAGDQLYSARQRERDEVEDVRLELEGLREEWERAASLANDIAARVIPNQLTPSRLDSDELVVMICELVTRIEQSAAPEASPTPSWWSCVRELLGCDTDDQVTPAIENLIALERADVAQRERDQDQIAELRATAQKLRSDMAVLTNTLDTERKECASAQNVRPIAEIDDVDGCVEALLDHDKRLAALERLAVGHVVVSADATAKITEPRAVGVEYVGDITKRLDEVAKERDELLAERRRVMHAAGCAGDARGLDALVATIASMRQAFDAQCDRRDRLERLVGENGGMASISDTKTQAEALDVVCAELRRCMGTLRAAREEYLDELEASVARALDTLAASLADQVEIGVGYRWRQVLAGQAVFQ